MTGTGRKRQGRERAPGAARRRRSQKSNFIVQGSLLAVAGILVRVIGMLYRVPLTAIIGTEGNGYYTSAFSIYSILLILSSYSLPTSISKIMSEKLARGRYRDIDRVMRVAFIYASLIGFVMFSLLYFGADALAAALHKPYASFALQALAPTIWAMAYLGILRGYFQGSGNMIPTALSQILEQIVNALISLIMALLLYRRGELANLIYNEKEYSYAFGAAGGTIGTGFGALSALLFFLLLYHGQKRGFDRMVRHDEHSTTDYSVIAGLLLSTMIPILVSSTVYNISTVLDDYLFGLLMTRTGKGESIVYQWGVFGEYRILFNIPVALANSIATSLIPSLSKTVAEGRRRQTKEKIRYSMRFILLLAIPSTIGLITLATPICTLLFPGKSVDMLIHVTRAGAIAVLFFSISTITNATLQGLGYLNIPLRNALLSLLIHVAAVFGLLYAGLQVAGIVIANAVFGLSMCILNEIAIRRRIRVKQNFVTSYLKPLLSGLLMGGAAYGVCRFLSRSLIPEGMKMTRTTALLVTLPSITAAILVYFFFLLLFRTFTREDLDRMPMGGRIKRFLR